MPLIRNRNVWHRPLEYTAILIKNTAQNRTYIRGKLLKAEIFRDAQIINGNDIERIAVFYTVVTV